MQPSMLEQSKPQRMFIGRRLIDVTTRDAVTAFNTMIRGGKMRAWQEVDLLEGIIKDQQHKRIQPVIAEVLHSVMMLDHAVVTPMRCFTSRRSPAGIKHSLEITGDDTEALVQEVANINVVSNTPLQTGVAGRALHLGIGFIRVYDPLLLERTMADANEALIDRLPEQMQLGRLAVLGEPTKTIS